MQRSQSFGFVAALAGGLAVTTTLFAAEDVALSAAAGLNSKKDLGLVTLVADSALSDGRLVLKLVAFNRTEHPAEFSAADVRISTAAGKAVALVSLDRLVAETRAAAQQPADAMNGEHDPSNYSHTGVRYEGAGGSGAPNVNGFTGASNPTAGVMSSHTQASRSPTPEKFDPKLQEQIANLNAAILHPLSIAPAQADGGQIVTERLKFSRKEEHALHVVVSFNGEQHEFDFAVPSAH